jgi:hypothetical protein
MAGNELAKKAIDAEIVPGTGAVVESHAVEPNSYGAGYDAGYIVGLRQVLAMRHGSAIE